MVAMSKLLPAAWLFAAACGSVSVSTDASAPVQLDVTLSSPGAGTVTSTPAGISCGSTCEASFPSGSTVALTAVANSGSTFSGWSGGGCTGTGACIVTLTTATTVTANFNAAMYALTISVDGDGVGAVGSQPGGIDCGSTGTVCSAMYPAGTMVTLTGTAGGGSSFGGWSGTSCMGPGPCTVTLNGPTTVNATFGTPSIYLINDTALHLQRITNLAAPVIVDVGALGSPFAFGDCTWDYANKKMFVVEGRNTQSLYTVNLGTGATTLIGRHGISDMFALAWYPVTGTLYGVGIDNVAGGGQALYTIDETTAAATRIGPTAIYANGLAWDYRRNQMVAGVPGSPFYTIDLATGNATVISGTMGLGNNDAVTYDPGNDKFWQANYDGLVTRFDPASNYAATQLLSAQGVHTCLTYVP
jgi:hypothetical protein